MQQVRLVRPAAADCLLVPPFEVSHGVSSWLWVRLWPRLRHGWLPMGHYCASCSRCGWSGLRLQTAGCSCRSQLARLQRDSMSPSQPVQKNWWSLIFRYLLLRGAAHHLVGGTYLILVSRPNTTGSVQVMIPIVWKYPGVRRQELWSLCDPWQCIPWSYEFLHLSQDR